MKRHFRKVESVITIAILISLLTGPGLYAAEETLPTPEEIIAKNIEAIGGINALKKIKNKKIVQSRKYDQMNMNIKDTIYLERPNHSYTVMDTGIREGSDGKIAWDISPISGAGIFEGNGLHTYLIGHTIDGPDGADAPYKSMKTEGVERVNGKDCFKVVKTPEKGWERIVYYDKKSFLIVKTIVNPITPQGTLIKVESYYEEYKKINGILFTYKVVSFINGQKYGETTIEKIELNIEMPEGIFDMPEEVKAILNQKQTGDEKKFDGTWKATVPGPDGNPLEITYVFKSSKYNLTGTVSTKLGGGPFFGGKIVEKNISFYVPRSGAIVHFNGTLSGDVINMIQKNGDDAKEFKLKRVIEGNEAGRH